jgi:hypothetical protein
MNCDQGAGRDSDGYGRDVEKSRTSCQKIEIERRATAPRLRLRQILRHIFCWSAALLSMAVFAWCMLGVIMLLFGMFNGGRPVIHWVSGKASTANMDQMIRHNHDNAVGLRAALARGCASIGLDVWQSDPQDVIVGAAQL